MKLAYAGVVAALFGSGVLFAATAAAPACCGDPCKKMGTCCKADDKGNITCPMGGSCCTKTDTKPAETKPGGGMGGMKMGM